MSIDHLCLLIARRRKRDHLAKARETLSLVGIADPLLTARSCPSVACTRTLRCTSNIRDQKEPRSLSPKSRDPRLPGNASETRPLMGERIKKSRVRF